MDSHRIDSLAEEKQGRPLVYHGLLKLLPVNPGCTATLATRENLLDLIGIQGFAERQTVGLQKRPPQELRWAGLNPA